MANNKCKECGCTCKKCIVSDHDVHLHVEIENLKQKLLERENHIVTMETNFLNEANKFPNGELSAIREELLTWQDKYKRLYDAHRRVQRVNQGLEDKLLRLVDTSETDKNTLTKDVATLSHKLAEANYEIKKLTEDNERYKNDVALAIQFLQCKQSNFVAHKVESLPQEVQSQVSNYMTTKKRPEERKTVPEIKSIKVPIPTFPPTAMVYSVPKSPNPNRKVEEEAEDPGVDIVSAAIMAKVLEERQRERACIKHCDTCTCSKNVRIIYDSTHHSVGTQTGEYKNTLCLQCNERMDNIPPAVKIVRDTTVRKVPIYPDSVENTQVNVNNVAKVQPNNCLLDNSSSKLDSNKSSLLDSSDCKDVKTNPIKNCEHVAVYTVDERDKRVSKAMSVSSQTSSAQILRKPQTMTAKHHYLCNNNSTTYEVVEEKADSEKNVDKASANNTSSENLKGPRYCSMRVQSGTKNILLDNTHSNVAPVLYTRQQKTKFDGISRTHNASHAESTSSEEWKNTSLMSSDSSRQNQQRVADWIQSTIDNDGFSNFLLDAAVSSHG